MKIETQAGDATQIYHTHTHTHNYKKTPLKSFETVENREGERSFGPTLAPNKICIKTSIPTLPNFFQIVVINTDFFLAHAATLPLAFYSFLKKKNKKHCQNDFFELCSFCVPFRFL